MTTQLKSAPISRIRFAANEFPEQTETEPITDQELGFWIRANARGSVAEFPSPAEFLFEQLSCPRPSVKTSRSFARDSSCLQEALTAIAEHYKQSSEPDTGLSDLIEVTFDKTGGYARYAVTQHLAGIERVTGALRRNPKKSAGVWDELLAKLDSYAQLRDGWNGYSASCPSQAAISNAREFLNVLWAAKLKPDRVRPSSVGGIGFTFRNRDRKVYAEFLNSGRTHVLFSDGIRDPATSEVSNEYRSFLSLIAEVRNYLNG